MPPIRLRSMRARMTTGFVLFMSVVVVVGSLALAQALQYVSKIRAMSQLDIAYASAQTILARYSDDHPSENSLVKMMKEHLSEINGFDVTVLVVDQHNRILWKSRKDVIRWPQHSQTWRWKAITFNHQKLVVGIPKKGVQNDFTERSWAFLALGILVIIGTALGAWWVVGRTLSPIGALVRQVKQASKEDLQVRLQPPSQDVEMVELVSTFNDLLKYLGDEAIMRSRFYAIASHELRTPLQALSGHLELALSRDRDNSAYKKVMQESLGQTQRLILLVQALLQLYQIENKTPPQQVQVNLSKIIYSQLALQHTWMERRALRTECNVEDVEWSAPPGHFDIVVRNLLENATKYSLKSSVINVDLQRHGEKVLLRIRNQCDKSQNDIPSAAGIDPLHKVDSYGLGMTICDAVTNANGWELQMMRDNGTMTVNVWMTA